MFYSMLLFYNKLSTNLGNEPVNMHFFHMLYVLNLNEMAYLTLSDILKYKWN